MEIKRKPKAAIVVGKGLEQKMYPARVRNVLEEWCEVVLDETSPDEMELKAERLREVEILFSGWGGARMDERVLSMMPGLKAVFYSAGSIKHIVTDEFWQRGIPICSAWAANAVPVAEFTLAQIILALKQVHMASGLLRKERKWVHPEGLKRGGAFGTRVALISLGEIGRRVAGMLKMLEVEVLAYDPFVSDEAAAALGVKKAGLEECFENARVVSLHTPWLPETEGLISGGLIRKMQVGATLINTSRGAVVNEPEMIEVLQERPDITAVLDVTYPEPPAPESQLYTLPNVFLTPHIAGSTADECGRLGLYMAEECRRFLAGEPLVWSVSREAAQRMA